LLDEPEKALTTAERGFFKHPDDPDLYVAIGKAYDALEDHARAIDAFEKAMINRSYAAEGHFNIALSKIDAGQKEDAREHLQQALELRPQFPQVLAELGVLELDAWNLELAERYIETFYDAYPGSKRARALMVQLHVRKTISAVRDGNLSAAEQISRNGLQIQPGSPDLNSVLGMIYAQ